MRFQGFTTTSTMMMTMMSTVTMTQHISLRSAQQHSTAGGHVPSWQARALHRTVASLNWAGCLKGQNRGKQASTVVEVEGGACALSGALLQLFGLHQLRDPLLNMVPCLPDLCTAGSRWSGAAALDPLLEQNQCQYKACEYSTSRSC